MIKIYTLSHPITKEVRYVGKTINELSKRLSQHLCDKRINKKVSWIKSLKKQGLTPEIELLETINDNDWKNEEIFYIGYFKMIGFKLVNMTEGGDGVEMTSEIKRKISIKHLGKILSQETKDKISKLNLDNKVGYYSKFSSDEAKLLRIKNKEKRDSKKPKSFQYKKIVQLDLNNNKIKIWDSICECCTTNNWSKGNLIKVCKNHIRKDGSKCVTAYGYKWKYYE
jgi:group I intron endonuclease